MAILVALATAKPGIVSPLAYSSPWIASSPYTAGLASPYYAATYAAPYYGTYGAAHYAAPYTAAAYGGYHPFGTSVLLRR